MTLQFSARLKLLVAVRTPMRSSAAVYVTLVCPQVAGIAETSVARRALVRFLSRVDSHVSGEIPGLTKRLATHATFVRIRLAVNSRVNGKVSRRRAPFAANSALEQFHAGMSLSVYHQPMIVLTALSTFAALVLTAVNIHV